MTLPMAAYPLVFFPRNEQGQFWALLLNKVSIRLFTNCYPALVPLGFTPMKHRNTQECGQPLSVWIAWAFCVRWKCTTLQQKASRLRCTLTPIQPVETENSASPHWISRLEKTVPPKSCFFILSLTRLFFLRSFLKNTVGMSQNGK